MNPNVDHPRWTQARERRIGEFFKRPTLMFNGYADQVAELYDRARPDYPTEVFDDLVALAQLPDRARVVEIGCGTGQGTRPLAV